MRLGVDVAERYDVIVIGAGLGGLLAAARFVGRGARVALVERLDHVGGRFTAKPFQGAQISTGAVHMLPFGSNGVVAALLRDLGVPHGVHDAEVFGSFLVRGRQIRARSLLSLLAVVGPRQSPALLRLGAAILLRPPRPEETQLTFAQWLARQGITAATHRELVRFFARVAHFTLSVDLDQVGYGEVAETLKNMLRYGPPGIVDGGCAAVAGALEARLRAAGATILLQHAVGRILTEAETAVGIALQDRATKRVRHLRAPLIISDIGPAATDQLLAKDATGDAPAMPHATGLKVHVLAKQSLIDHRGILYCLDTERIAGIVQPSNSDPRLAPPGEHLIITHQLWRPERETIAEARSVALADLARVLGSPDGDRWRVLTMSQYHDEWPVNRAAQGADTIPTTATHGLYLVGDAVKPSGYLMVEGVAQSVNAMLDAVDRFLPDPAHPAHMPPRPSRRRALHWLVAPPPPQRESAAHPKG